MKNKHRKQLDQNLKLNSSKTPCADDLLNMGKYFNTLGDLQSEAQPVNKTTATVKLLLDREERLKLYRYKIGILSNEIIEDPTGKSNNFRILLNLLDERSTDVCITVKTLAIASLLEIFNDLVPSYHFLQSNKKDITLKKETLQLETYESSILKYYKQYLQKLEKIASTFKRKYLFDLKEQDVILGILSIQCMSNLLIKHPYFNFSSNITHFLIPFLNHRYRGIRQLVANYFVQLLHNDKRGEISLVVVRNLNQFIKTRKELLHDEVMLVLNNLQLNFVNDEKKNEVNTKIKKNGPVLSKKEKKRNNKLKLLKNEILETKAEENKSKRQKVYTETITLAFTIYFRLLKETSSNQVLSSCLIGLSKFSEYINVDFHYDLVNVLDKILDRNDLPTSDQLSCISIILTTLLNQSSVLDIRPIKFYEKFYQTLLNMHLGKNYEDIDIAIKILQLLLHKRNDLSQNCLFAFTKRICTMSLNLQHNGTLAFIYTISQSTQRHKEISILFDTENNEGITNYLPEFINPEYCNANTTNLWEMIALQRHFHQSVTKTVKNLINRMLCEDHSFLINTSKISPEDAYSQFSPLNGTFNPAILVPKKKLPKKQSLQNNNYVKELSKVHGTFDIKSTFGNRYVDILKNINNCNMVGFSSTC